jgi:hypothetical protein
LPSTSPWLPSAQFQAQSPARKSKNPNIMAVPLPLCFCHQHITIKPPNHNQTNPSIPHGFNHSKQPPAKTAQPHHTISSPSSLRPNLHHQKITKPSLPSCSRAQPLMPRQCLHCACLQSNPLPSIQLKLQTESP